MKKTISRRSFNFGLLSLVTAPFVQASALLDKNRGNEHSYFSMLLPSEFANADLALQSFAMDDVNNAIYGQFSTRTRPSSTIIAKYSLEPDSENLPVSIQPQTHLIGHQGLTIQHTGKEPWLWAAAPGRSREVVRFRYQESNLKQVETFTLFDDSYQRATITVAVSYDGKWLIAASKKNQLGGAANAIRIFDLEKNLQSNSNDWSRSFAHEWEIQTYDDFPVQGLACLDNTVAVSLGTSKASQDKPLLFFTLEGAKTGMLTDTNPGKNSLEPRASYEPEGLCFSRVKGSSKPILFIGITTGRSETGRTYRLYALK